jgi:hypothetical protein
LPLGVVAAPIVASGAATRARPAVVVLEPYRPVVAEHDPQGTEDVDHVGHVFADRRLKTELPVPRSATAARGLIPAVNLDLVMPVLWLAADP